MTDKNQGYEPLRRILDDAFTQAAHGKGAKRHCAQREGFDEQPIIAFNRRTGLGGPIFQIMKKADEAAGMVSRRENDAAREELLGAIVYAAAAIRLLELQNAEPTSVTVKGPLYDPGALAGLFGGVVPKPEDPNREDAFLKMAAHYFKKGEEKK